MPERKKALAKLKDIAERLGVSISTVSRAISGDRTRPVSEETKRRVLDAARELGYPLQGGPAHAAGADRVQLACILPGGLMGHHPYFTAVLEGFHRKLEELGQPPALMRASEELREPGRLASMLEESGTRGVLALSWYDSRLYGQLAAAGVPIVGVSLNDESIFGVPIVDCDRLAAARLAVRHLQERGHARIGFVGGPAFDRTLERDERYIGYKFAMLEADRHPDPRWIVNSEWIIEKSYSETLDMLRRLGPAERPSAIFCASDSLAIPAMRAVIDSGLRIPEDIAFVGMDNIEFAQYTSPPLTSVHVPREEIGAAACTFLLDYAQGEHHGARKLLLPCELIVRESSGAAPGGADAEAAVKSVENGAERAAESLAERAVEKGAEKAVE